MDVDTLASCIELSAVGDFVSRSQLRELCDHARTDGLASICVESGYVPEASRLLQGTKVKVCSLVGSPSGNTLLPAAIAEAKLAVSNGAKEVCVALHAACVKRDDEKLRNRVRAFRDQLPNGVLLKVSVELHALAEPDLHFAWIMAKQGGADMIVTSTGLRDPEPWRPLDTVLRLMSYEKRNQGEARRLSLQITGIETLADALAAIEAGADRISIKPKHRDEILEEARQNS